VRLGRGGWKGYVLGGAMAGMCAAWVGVSLEPGGPQVEVAPVALEIDSHRTAASPVAAPPGVTATAPTPTTVPAPPPAPAVASPPPTAAIHAAVPMQHTRVQNVARALPPGAGGTWAVVLGVDDYQGNGNLQAGVADANEIVATLLDADVPGDHILLLRNWEVTPASIAAAADWLVDHVNEDGLAVFAWAGHVRALGPTTEALATGNGGLVTDVTLAAHLRQLRSRRSWFLIAGCYGGGFNEILGPGRLLTAASTADHEAYENTLLGHSYVVEYVVRRDLHRREGPRVISGAVAWAQQKIRKEHPGREPVEYASGPLEPFVLGPNPTPTPAELRAAA
jgi:hypothetical protein